MGQQRTLLQEFEPWQFFGVVVSCANRLAYPIAVVLSKDLRDQIGIDGEVRFVGRGSSFQLWEPGKRATYEATAQTRSQELSPSIRLGGLH